MEAFYWMNKPRGVNLVWWLVVAEIVDEFENQFLDTSAILLKKKMYNCTVKRANSTGLNFSIICVICSPNCKIDN